jgi:hypothetical protein
MVESLHDAGNPVRVFSVFSGGRDLGLPEIVATVF